MSIEILEMISKGHGFSIDDLKKGYCVTYDGDFGVELIQKIDILEQYGLEKFKSDTEAGEQALKDGYKLFTVEHEDLDGWYILDTSENRNNLKAKGYL